MDIRNLLALVFRKLWLIVLAAVLAGMVVYVGMSRSEAVPRYSATTVVAIGGDIYGETLDTVYIELADIMMANLLKLSKLEVVTGAVTHNLGLAESPEEVAEMLDVSQVEGTNLLSIRATHRTPETAVAVANEVANQLRQLSPSRWRNFVLVMESAQLPTIPDNVTILPVILTSFMAALFMASIIFLIEFFRRPFYDERDVSEMLGLPTIITLKSVPFIWQRFIRGNLMTESEPTVWWSLKEACRRLMDQDGEEVDQQTILVISPDASISHAYVAGHLAIACANEGQKTVLADIDLTRADATKLFFEAAPNAGFASLIRHPDSDPSKLLQNVPKNQHLWMLGSNQEEGSRSVGQLHKAIQGLWTLVEQSPCTIISAGPPVSSVETLMAASRTTLVLLVMDVRYTRYQQAAENVSLLAANNVAVDGVVLADMGTRGAVFSIAWRVVPFIRHFMKRFWRAPKPVSSSYNVDRQT